jgi:adenine phosphoribosyltransferase
MDQRVAQLIAHIRDVSDFPKPGILFKDVTPLLGDGPSLRTVVDLLAEQSGRPELVVGIEARGFIFGAMLAERLGAGFVPVRKPGKLPWKSLRETYALEYGNDSLELHEDAVGGRRCLIVDDLLATGGTAGAAGRLVERGGGLVEGFSFVVELDFLHGREKLGGRPVHSLIHY